ncbi:N-formylglutamate deformylase [Klebsiella quasipneumoniae]|nr:N-formylglutamate deformylase [Klebsiella quasipneumoniae]
MIKAFDLQQGNLPLLVSMPHPGTLLTPEVAQGLTPRAGLGFISLEWRYRRRLLIVDSIPAHS